MPRCTPWPTLERVNCPEPLPFSGVFPRTLPPGDARLSRNSTLPAVTARPPDITVAVSVSLAPTRIEPLDTPRLVAVNVCPAAVQHKVIPTRSANTGCCISANIERINRTNLRQMEAEFSP